MAETSSTWASAAESHVSRTRLTELCAAMVNIASPPGEETELATFLADEMARGGLDGQLQPVSGDLANAHGHLAGNGSRPSLMLYAPIDTVIAGTEDDVPWVGPELRDDMRPRAQVLDGLVIGLGAQNPKGHGACVLAAGEALVAAGVPLLGDLILGFGGGGMPTNRRSPDLPDAHGIGCKRLVDALQPDQAVIAKTGWAISWEEVGLTWFEVDVSGTHTYVGSRHLMEYRNAIAAAGRMIVGLETWFESWADEHRHGLVAPQGVVSAIEGGRPHAAAFTPALCRFWVDLRLSPRTTGEEAKEAFGREVDRLAAELGAEVSWRQTLVIPGTTTAPDSPVIRSAISCWEAIEGRSHESIDGMSGATDANILRSRRIPTARVGLPKVDSKKLDLDFQLGMNAVDVEDMERLTKLLIRIAIDLCGDTE